MDSSYSPHGLIGVAYRPPKIGSKGAIVANHTMAAQAGMRILHQGGNAVDAAIAVAFALGPAEPQGSSIGGDEPARPPWQRQPPGIQTAYRSPGFWALRSRGSSMRCSRHTASSARYRLHSASNQQ